MDSKMHHAIDELNSVHTRMKLQFQRENAAAADINRAAKMEQYLRLLKKIGNTTMPQDLESAVDYQRILMVDGMESLAQEVGTMLNINRYGLFRNQHAWYRGENAKLGADDIAEAELYALLTKAGEKALINNSQSIDLGVNIIGGVSGNIKNASAVTSKVNSAMKEMMASIDENFVQSKTFETEIIEAPTARSAKVDVTGYNKTINVQTQIKPEWQDFFQTFQGANFSLKNYSSNTKVYNNIIHLGNTNTLKAMYGVLTASLNYSENEATHIYVHTRFSYLKGGSAARGEGPSHIMHMRFVYELTGSGLWTETDHGLQQLDEVDFFIYNDPGSDNIYVKSAKEMIANAFKYIDQSKIGDPWNSSIVILKSSFN